MRQFSILAGAASVLMLTATASIAAPCATGSTAANAGQMESKDKSSKVEPGSTSNVTPGAKAESPGTVGAMNNAGASRATSADDVAKQQDGKPTAATEGQGC